MNARHQFHDALFHPPSARFIDRLVGWLIARFTSGLLAILSRSQAEGSCLHLLGELKGSQIDSVNGSMG